MIVFLVAAMLATSASGQADGRRMLSVQEQPAWNAVGRLNLGDAFCTAALVAPDLVVTAAHCLYVPLTGLERSPHRVHFVAGYRLRRHEGHRTARTLKVHPDYDYSQTTATRAIGADLALVWLNAPLDDIAPLSLAPGIAAGDEVAILSYGRDRPEIPSIQSPCTTTARVGPIVALNCDITFGVSGAPVFRQIDGEWRIVAVISSMGSYRGEPHAFAVALDEALTPLLSR